MNFSAVILAGGKSSRMGRDKAFLEIGGQTLLARQIQVVREAGAVEVFISGRAEADYSSFGCPVLKDKFPDAGPLAGIERALDAISSPMLLALAVENSGVVPRLNGNLEPLAAFYPKTALPLAVSLLNENANAVKHFAERCAQAALVNFVDAGNDEARLFLNYNSPADLVPISQN
jgi:molybdopterin-guanine dinucleotide biosynthesis protein A